MRCAPVYGCRSNSGARLGTPKCGISESRMGAKLHNAYKIFLKIRNQVRIQLLEIFDTSTMRPCKCGFRKNFGELSSAVHSTTIGSTRPAAKISGPWLIKITRTSVTIKRTQTRTRVPRNKDNEITYRSSCVRVASHIR